MNSRVSALAALSVALSSLLSGQEPGLDRRLSCVASLELPTQGLFAARAATSGTVTAVISLDAGGRLAALKLTGNDEFLKGEVGVSLSGSRFTPKCRHRSVEVIYSFTLEDPATDLIIPPAVRFVPPNRFELTFRRVKPNVDPAPPSEHK